MSESSLTFSTFGSVQVNDNSRVNIPDDRRADFQRAANYFAARSNRTTMTVPFDTEADAKLFAKQVRQWAEDTGRSSSPKRDGKVVTFRIAKTREASKNGEVTVTHTTPANAS